MKSKIVIGSKQNLADITIQVMGNIEAWFDMAKAADKSITEDLEVDSQIEVTATPLDNEIVQFYKSKNIQPATAVDIKELPAQSGVNYWIIGQDFTIQ